MSLVSNFAWCAGWLWFCLGAEAVFVLWRHASVPSLVRFPWPLRLVALLLGALWVFGATDAVMPCTGWSMWLTRLLGCCGWTVAVCASVLDKWQPLAPMAQLAACITVFAGGLFFLMIVPYDISAGRCYPTLFYQLAPFICQLLLCAYTARHVWRSHRCDYPPEVERASRRYDRRSRPLCLAFLAAVPVLSAPTHLGFGVPALVYMAIVGAALAVIGWSVVDLLEPTFRFARSDIGFSHGFASVALHEDAEAQATLRAISIDNPEHMRIALTRCSEFKDLNDHFDRADLVVRQFVIDRGIEVWFRLFVAIMLRNECSDENWRRRLTDAIFTVFIISQEAHLGDDAKAIITTDINNTADEFLFDNLVRVINNHMDMHRYRWNDLRLDQLRNRVIYVPGVHPEPAPSPPSPQDLEAAAAERMRLENEREVEAALRQMQTEREERLARFRASEDFILH